MQIGLPTSEGSSAIVLVDYSNVRPSTRAERDADEVRVSLDAIGEQVADCLSGSLPQIREAEVWLYDGWLFKGGNETPCLGWVRANLSMLRGLRRGIRLIPSIRTGVASAPSTRLLGTLRKKSQKMVDTMLAVDYLYLATRCVGRPVVVASDDDDMLPAVLQVAQSLPMPEVGWLLLRHRPLGECINDDLLDAAGVSVSVLGTRTPFGGAS